MRNAVVTRSPRELAHAYSLISSSADLPSKTHDARRSPACRAAGATEAFLPATLRSLSLLGTSPSAPANAAAPPTHPDDGHYWFYQAADGQWLFLCPLNMRMLLAHHGGGGGGFAACPPLLSARVLEVEHVLQSESSRKRMKVTGHLPAGGAFKV